MSSNTKIVVLKSRELIYTGIFAVLGIGLILLMIYMFSSKKDEKSSDEKTATTAFSDVSDTSDSAASDIAGSSAVSYTPGTYSSELSLGGYNLAMTVTVNDQGIPYVSIENMDEAVSAMYPLITPSLEDINAQLAICPDIDSITYSEDNQYTTIIITDAIKRALTVAQ